MSKVRELQQRRGWAWTVVVGIVKPTLLALTKRDWRHGEKVPATGGCVVVVNHISHLDPMTLGHFLYDHGRLVRYLTKDALFRTPVVRHVVRDAGQIPVRRQTEGAATAFAAAVDAVRAGECVGVYPEGSITKDPEGWPMRGKTGSARIALATGAPVVPIGQWGAQEVLPAYSARPHLFPRRTTHYLVGDPVDLSDLADQPLTPELLREGTDRIMAAITALVEELRGERAPAVRFDPRSSGINEIGNPHQQKREHG
ncbi:1-acyl-sn-glycerol-3-phosphate acyltransferases [Nocardioides scoriae]|uniref:1-acyl-sn-glycerol-3-phosphate acyltransferases n=1 Tax=Nocardioides scoriae TaxID=642780 RepID=A0A1H1YCT4_9ACTN|nr:lysophospholipid acyltransferase family protein [Nocardioides scoriae]SDT19191.1 1-acyl-sn-glycerol-3-phosphate acyltransferases [Nocardioides scoriae]